MLDGSFIKKLEERLAPEAVLVEPHHVLAYECDGSTAFRSTPDVVVLPRTTDDVSAVVLSALIIEG